MISKGIVSSLLSTVIIATLSAHEDPTSVAEKLTHDIEHFLLENKGQVLAERKHDLADLYFLRANEFRAIGRKQKAYADLLKYIELKPIDFKGWIQLSSLEIEIEKQFEYLEKALKLAELNSEKSYVYFALAEHFYSIDKYQLALNHCNQSISLAEGEQITSILFKAHILWELNLLDQRVDFLAKALEKNSSDVLKRAWIDAKLDADHIADVKQEIHEQVKDSRFKSSWLIRASRCEKEGSVQAKKYAQAAIDEILSRFHSYRPDMTLQMDLVRAYSLLNEEDADEKAQQYFDLLKAADFNKWELSELSEILKN